MKKILFVCAMKKEALDIIKELELERKQENYYTKENKTVLITNIGKQRTAIALTQQIERYGKPDIIINVGYAGSTNLPIGKWVNIQKSYNYEWNIPGEERFNMPEIRKSEFA